MDRERSVAVGLDIMGSGATAALVDHQGRILQRRYARTLKGRPASATLEPYFRAIDELLAYAQGESLAMHGIGISIPGSVDETGRRSLFLPTLPSLSNLPLCNIFESRYELHTQLHVDVEAAVQGEYRFGAGRGVHRLLFLTVNAVVGAALVVDGKLEQSAQRLVGHICHLPVATNGPRCSCGKHGCINTLVSVDAMQRLVQRALRRGDESGLTQRLLNHEYFSPQLLIEEARKGDSVALYVYNEIGRRLSIAIEKYVDTFNPHALVLGGSVLYANELLLAQVRTAVESPVNVTASNVLSMLKIASSALGNDAGLIGTATSFLL